MWPLSTSCLASSTTLWWSRIAKHAVVVKNRKGSTRLFMMRRHMIWFRSHCIFMAVVIKIVERPMLHDFMAHDRKGIIISRAESLSPGPWSLQTFCKFLPLQVHSRVIIHISILWPLKNGILWITWPYGAFTAINHRRSDKEASKMNRVVLLCWVGRLG